MVALILSSVVIILVSGTFLVQSQYYSSQRLHVAAHDNVRVATERVASEIRSTMEGGFVVAGPHTLTVRSAISLTSVCDRAGNDMHVYMDGGAAGLHTEEVAGVALRDEATGAWDFRTVSWAVMDGGSTNSAGYCAGNGADTAAAGGEFHELLGVGSTFSSAHGGDILMLFGETTFKIQTSVLDPATLGLFRQPSGGSLVEFASGMDSTAQFQYRTGGATYADTVVGSSVASIDAVRIVADARLRARSGALSDATFGWSVNVPLRNGP